MIKEYIEILKGRMGSYGAVAVELGITERHLLNIRKNRHCGGALRKLIIRMVVMDGSTADIEKGLTSTS